MHAGTSIGARPDSGVRHAESVPQRRLCEAARQHALTLAEVEQWKDDFITQGTEALRSHPRDLAQQFEAREKTLLAKVGELTLHVDVLKKAHRYQGKDLPEGISW